MRVGTQKYPKIFRRRLAAPQTHKNLDLLLIFNAKGGCGVPGDANATLVPVPGLVMQHAILLVCFASSFASFGKVLA